jgi:hypothetical protein
MKKTIFNGTFNRFLHQLTRLTEYTEFFGNSLSVSNLNNKDKIKKVGQFHIELLIIALFNFFEEYQKSIIFTASIHQEVLVRKYFKRFGKEDIKKKVKSCDKLGDLGHYTLTEVSFKKKSHRLKRIFEYLCVFALFPDIKTENLIHDFILVRTIIVHEGGNPNQKHNDQINSEDIIISSEIKIKNNIHRFYKLNLADGKFFKNVLSAINDIFFWIEKNALKDPRFAR